MRDLVVLLLHLLATVARLAGPGSARAGVAESALVKRQLLILNRSRERSPKTTRMNPSVFFGHDWQRASRRTRKTSHRSATPDSGMS